ncbi:MAG: hydrogenase maturation peptidase HycI [Methanobacteriaceae archaeon]|nr:hydrogenase maturation peptidase HycI [Methanobacteriaceae archaeon]
MLLEKELKKFLENYENLVIMGIGNELKTDDGLGPYIINYLTPKLKNKNNVTLINAGSAPENFTGKIKTLNPTHIILIDAVIMEEKPGFLRLVKKEEIKNMGISSHNMPLSYLINYLELEKTYKILFIGVQPADLSLQLGLTSNVKESAENLGELILKLL